MTGDRGVDSKMRETGEEQMYSEGTADETRDDDSERAQSVRSAGSEWILGAAPVAVGSGFVGGRRGVRA